MPYCVVEDIEEAVSNLLQKITDEPVKHAASGGADTLQHKNVKSILYVNNTAGKGPDAPDYAATTYQVSSARDKIDWSPTGAEPTASATYYVTYEFHALAPKEINNRIDDADALIDSKLVGRYKRSDYAGSPQVNRLSIDLASFYVAEKLFAQQGDEIPEWIFNRFERAMNFLEELCKGMAQLLDDAGALITPAATTTTVEQLLSNTKDYTPITDVDDVEDWLVDPDRVTDIASARA